MLLLAYFYSNLAINQRKVQMFFQQIYDKTLSQASYIIGCQATGEAIVIDAKRDVDSYIDIAKAERLRITHVAETHIHADFLSGTRELAVLTGAGIYLSDEGGADWQYVYPHTGLHKGDRLTVGNLSLEVLHTPGHTPESISFLLRDHPSSEHPVMLFSGDFVFVGDIGRPDLLERVAHVDGAKEEGAWQMFQSLETFRKLPDYVQVWPGHGAGSACGKALGAVPSSTVGYEKIRNWAFQFAGDFEKFKTSLLSDQPEVPPYFAHMKRMNRFDRPLLLAVPQYPILVACDVQELDNARLVDARPKAQYAHSHVLGSLNIQHNKSMATWSGWMLPYGSPIAIIAPKEEHAEITRKLMRIGFDDVAGFIDEIERFPTIMSHTLNIDGVDALKDTEDCILLDVRNQKEYRGGHLPGAVNCFVGDLPHCDLSAFRDKHLIVYCQSGDRASIAYSYLEQEGFDCDRLSIYLGSVADWQANGRTLVVD